MYTLYGAPGSGSAAVEFALVLPVLCTALFGIADGWSYVSSSLAMRAGVKTAANLLLVGASDDNAIQAAALASWQRKHSRADRHSCRNLHKIRSLP